MILAQSKPKIIIKKIKEEFDNYSDNSSAVTYLGKIFNKKWWYVAAPASVIYQASKARVRKVSLKTGKPNTIMQADLIGKIKKIK